MCVWKTCYSILKKNMHDSGIPHRHRITAGFMTYHSLSQRSLFLYPISINVGEIQSALFSTGEPVRCVQLNVFQGLSEMNGGNSNIIVGLTTPGDKGVNLVT